MKNIYFVQANAVYGDTVKSTYIPYAAGCIISYAMSIESIRDNYSFSRFIYTREDIDTALTTFEDPFIVGISSSVWNNEYNKAFAKALKENGLTSVQGRSKATVQLMKYLVRTTDAEQ